MKIKPAAPNQNAFTHLFECPACNILHGIDDKIWKFDGNMENPTVNPSIMVRHGDGIICHSQINGGKIYFYQDSTHALAGQLVELPEVTLI